MPVSPTPPGVTNLATVLQRLAEWIAATPVAAGTPAYAESAALAPTLESFAASDRAFAVSVLDGPRPIAWYGAYTRYAVRVAVTVLYAGPTDGTGPAHGAQLAREAETLTGRLNAAEAATFCGAELLAVREVSPDIRGGLGTGSVTLSIDAVYEVIP